MHIGAKPLLEHHPVFHSRNVEEARAFLHSKDFQLDGIDPRQVGEFDARINGVYLPAMWLGYIQYGSPASLRAAGRDDYWLHLPVRGQLEVVGRSDSVACDRRRAAVASPGCSNAYLVRSGPGCGGIRLSLTRAPLLAQLAVLLGEPPGRALEFAPEMDVTAGYGLTLARYLLMAIADLGGSGSMLANPHVGKSFEQLILTALLLSHPHTYSEALQRRGRPIAPRDVKRAVEYIEAHLDTGFTVADLVQATGVAGRTLFKHFKDFKGVSPMRYARNARFEQVRQALLRGDAEQGVTEIAASCGFGHPGRFAVEYRQRFGESPSQTLRRQRHRR
jgi:AraC-like DNA-binding protein